MKSKKKTVHDIRVEELYTDNNMAVLFRKFDITFKNETTDGACNAYCKLKTSEKQTEMSVTNYIMEYKHLYCAMIEHDTPFPDKCTSIQITWWSKFITGRA